MLNRLQIRLSILLLTVLILSTAVLVDITVAQERNKTSEFALSMDNEELIANEMKVLKAINKVQQGESFDSAPESESATDLAFKKMKENIGKPVKKIEQVPAKSSARASLKLLAKTPQVNKKIPVKRSSSSTIKKQKAQVTALRADNYSLQSKLSSSEERIMELLAELKKTRNQLLVAETEIERLSQVMEDRNIASVGGTSTPVQATAVNQAIPTGRFYPPAPRKIKKTDMPIATVMAKKANLRAGPGKKNSVLLQVSKGTRLVVEKRLGDWYRVLAPNGTRAWISGTVVAFGKNNYSSPSRTIRIQSYDSSLAR